MSLKKNCLIEVNNIKKYFKVGKKRYLKAVDNVSFKINKGETLGVVGESGCGKSTTGKVLVNILDKTEGKIFFEGKSYDAMTTSEKKEYQLNVQMIFQDPYSSLNPRMKVMDIISEGMTINKIHNKEKREEIVYSLLEKVGLSREHSTRYAHEFSGGQRQRIGIARALSMNPKFIVCDEPISALDVSIQAQIVNLLNNLQREYELTYLFIAHDINMVRLVSDEIAVMYLGNIVEIGSSYEVFHNPIHPYTEALISAVPKPNPVLERSGKRIILEGDVPSPMVERNGCVFEERCRYATDICLSSIPKLREIRTNYKVACHNR